MIKIIRNLLEITREQEKCSQIRNFKKYVKPKYIMKCIISRMHWDRFAGLGLILRLRGIMIEY